MSEPVHADKATPAVPRLVVAAVLLAGLTIGVAAGIGSYTFIYARGGSYMTDEPTACANCHIMQGQYDAWVKSSHHAVATCNDCHTPHDFTGKYMTKALNGYHHSMAFTLQNFHEPIQITGRNLAIAEANCRYCHADVVAAIDTHAAVIAAGQESEPMSCIKCHPSVGHME